MWNPLSWVMEGAALVAIALSNGGGRVGLLLPPVLPACGHVTDSDYAPCSPPTETRLSSCLLIDHVTIYLHAIFSHFHPSSHPIGKISSVSFYS
jgi:hypothetical protein